MTQARTAGTAGPETTTELFVNRAKKLGDELWKAGTNMLHAGVGVAVATEERARETFGRMVDKGKGYEADEDRFFSRATREIRELGRGLERGIERGVSVTLHRVGVPSREEINQLGMRVENLTRKLDQLASNRPVVGPVKEDM